MKQEIINMNILTDPQHLKSLLKSLHFKPNEVLGQNFLVDEVALDEIINVAEIAPNETIIEIGPGLGVLTQRLVAVTSLVIAIEKDERFVPVLKNYFKHSQNLKIFQGDALKFNFEAIKGEYKIVANIPYYLTSHLLQLLLALKHQPTRMVLMMQKEVGERLTAHPGELSLLSISAQIFADIEIAANVSNTSFWPQPKVGSCIVVITPRDKYPEIADHKLFFRILKIAFAGKRKQIHNTLVNGLKLPKAEIEAMLTQVGIDSKLRPQDISIEQWIELYKLIHFEVYPS